MEETNIIINIIGWIGASSLLTSYLLISNGKTHGKSRLYQSLNLLGSTGLIINSYYYGAMPSVILNVIWVFIGIRTLGLLFFAKRKKGYE